jgi:hypothetical protein
VFTGAAAASDPTHLKGSFSGGTTIPAGDFCDFNYGSEFTLYFNDIVFGDPDNPAKIIEEATVYAGPRVLAPPQS